MCHLGCAWSCQLGSCRHSRCHTEHLKGMQACNSFEVRCAEHHMFKGPLLLRLQAPTSVPNALAAARYGAAPAVAESGVAAVVQSCGRAACSPHMRSAGKSGIRWGVSCCCWCWCCGCLSSYCCSCRCWPCWCRARPARAALDAVATPSASLLTVPPTDAAAHTRCGDRPESCGTAHEDSHRLSAAASCSIDSPNEDTLLMLS